MTLGLAAAGAVAGAVVCWLSFLTLSLLFPRQVPEWRTWFQLAVLPLLLLGAVPGAVIAPVIGWRWLRRVPIALGLTVVPTAALAGVIGFVVAGGNFAGLGWLGCALAGVAAATAGLSRRYPARPHGAGIGAQPSNKALKLSGMQGRPATPADRVVRER
ncbi:MAG TPA: hypothetical protein VGD56_03570 [Gemmatirosa sp.]